jgi:hypothetical protein
MTVMPGGIYDAIGTVSQSYALARLADSGKLSIVHDTSASERYPTGSRKLVLGADGNIYGFGSQSTQLNPPFFIYRLTPSGEYSGLLNFPGSYGVAHGSP